MWRKLTAEQQHFGGISPNPKDIIGSEPVKADSSHPYVRQKFLCFLLIIFKTISFGSALQHC